MATKVIKLQTIYTSDDTMNYKEYCKEVFSLLREITIVKNEAMAHMYMNKRHDVIIPISKETKAASPSGLANAYATSIKQDKDGNDIIIRNHSSNVATAVQETWDKFRKFCKDSKGAYAVSVPSFKDNGAICLHNKCIKLDYDSVNNNFTAKLFLFSQKYAKQIGVKSSDGFDYKLIVGDNSSKAILERIISGEYKLSASNLQWDKRKKKWYLLIGYSFKEKQPSSYNPEENRDKVMGINLGVICPMYMSFSHCKNRYCIDENEIEAFRKQIEARRIALRKQRKYCGDGSIGHGKNKRNEPAMKIDDKIARFRDTANHKYSRYAVDMAIKHKCGTIVIEDLTGIAEKEERLFLKSWSYYDLQNKLAYKAKEAGIEVVTINPQYISRRCSKCGYISLEKEENIKAPDYRKFKCVDCGFEAHVDYNASQNNAIIGIEQIIADTVALQKETQKEQEKIQEET